MAFETAEKNFVTQGSNVAKTLLGLYPTLLQRDALWAGSPTYKTSITQADLDSVASFNATGLTTSSSGTVGTLPDVEFLFATIKTAIANAIPALTIMANLP